MSFDGHATREEIKLLYAACQAVRRHLNVPWQSFFNDHIKLATGIGFEANLRKGNIGQSRASAIHNWIATHHLNTAIAIAPEIFHGSLLSDWQRFLKDHAQYGNLKAVSLGGMGLTEISDGNPIGGTLRLGAEFCFTLQSHFRGNVLAFEEFDGYWHGLPLSGDGVALTTAIDEGQNLLPSNSKTGKPIALRERTDIGEHGYVFLIGDAKMISACAHGILPGQRIAPRQLDTIAHRLEQAETRGWEVHRLNVIFVA